MKVISGFLRGRVIKGFNLDGTRPTMDRVKESLFAIIQNHIQDSICLDLFAGSASLGIEAISNGSKLVYFNDLSREAIKVISSNIKNFNIEDNAVILNYDYKKCLNYLKEINIKFDVIFLDPPYNKEVINEIIDTILLNDILNNDGIIVCEVSNDYLKEFDLLERIKEKKYGDKQVVIYKKHCK